MADVREQLRVTAPLDEPEEPTPPRFWWLKRILAGVLVLMVLVGVSRVWWGWEADRRLAAAIAAAQARGEPVWPEDFARQVVPDDQNAVVLLRRAGEAYRPPRREFDELLYDRDIRAYVLAGEGLELLIHHLEENREALALIRDARSRPGIAWEEDWLERLLADSWESSEEASRQRSLAELLRHGTRLAQHQNDSSEAIELVRDGLHLARVLDERGFLIDHLVALVAESMASSVVSELAGYLNIRDRQQAEALIRELLEDEGRRERAVRAWWFDRALGVQLLNHLPRPSYRFDMESGWRRVEPTWVDEAAAWAFRPLDVMRMAAEYERLTRDAEMIQRQAVSVLRPGVGVAPRREPVNLPVAAWYFEPPFQSRPAFWLVARHMLDRRISAAKLALRMYELDHGELPEGLEELVPQYLPYVPADPYVADGRGLGYVRDGEETFLYSVFEDGVDDVAAGWTPAAGDHENWRGGTFVSFYRLEKEESD